MFDTITLLAFDIDVNPNKLVDGDQFTYLDENGEYRTRIKFRKEKITFIYRLQQRTLEIELSIPKLIYGTNTQLLTTSDITTFWIRLNEILVNQLDMVIDKEQWKVKRLDISYNFQVNNVGNYIIELSKLNIAKRDKMTYNQNETVLFKNKSSSICFYDKEKECIKRKEDANVINKAKGVLRLEVRPAGYHMRKYSSLRKATDLLSKEYFSFIIDKLGINEILTLLNFQKVDSDKDDLQKALIEMKATDIEKILGFSRLIDEVGEKELLESGHYKGGTFRNRKELLHQYAVITAKEESIQKKLYVLSEY